MKRFALAIALTCALSGSGFGGIVHSTDKVATAPGEIPTVGSQSPGNMSTDGSTALREMPTCGLAFLLTVLDLAV